MKTIEYFKLQSKNLYKDFKTRKTSFDSSVGRNVYEYAPKFFDVEALISDFDIDEESFTLMNAQHYIARLAGFEKWTEMLKASRSVLDLSKLLFENMHKISLEEWDLYLSGEERSYGEPFGDEMRLDIFKTVFNEIDGHQSDGTDYRLPKNQKLLDKNQIIESKQKKMDKRSTEQISSLPLVGADRLEFIRTANSVFENVLKRIEPKHPQIVRRLWNAEKYIDELLLKPEMLPIDRDYALSLIDAFLVHHIIELASEAENLMKLN